MARGVTPVAAGAGLETETDDEPAGGLVVGRRPVLSADLVVTGYRLAVAGPGGSAGILTEQVADRIVASGSPAGLFGAKPAFLRPSRSFLVGERELPELAAQTVIEVDSCSAADPEVVAGCRRMLAEGRLLAVDCRTPHSAAAAGPLLQMASYVRLDIGAAPVEELAAWVEAVRQAGLHPIAAGVDTPAQLGDARRAGFETSEGRLLSRPVAVVTGALTPSRLACLQMLETVNDPRTSAADLDRVVSTDPGLSYRLLHVSGLGAAGGLRRQVRSIREAVVLLGREAIHRWLIMMAFADANQGTPEQMTIAMTRARMCETVASAVAPAERDAAFTVGLVSALDLLLGAPLEDVLSKLAITAEIREALLDRAGPLGAILADVLDWELGVPGSRLRSGVPLLGAEAAYLGAVAWASDLQGALTRH